MRSSWIRTACLSGLGYAGAAARFGGPPAAWERRLFTALNRGPEMSWLRLPQQLGTPWALVSVAAGSLVAGRRRDAAAALLVLPLEKGAEVGTKKLLRRDRPLYDLPTELRDDAPVEGPGFPSGHAAIATATCVLVGRHLPSPARTGLAVVTGVSGLVRTHQGAHYPTDVVGGVLLGVSVASAALAAVGDSD